MFFAISIDGPAGSGKSSVAKLFSEWHPNFVYINTGLMYRAVSYYLVSNNIPYEDEAKVKPYLNNIHLSLKQNNIYLNNQDVTPYVRNNEIDKITSLISTYPSIREKLISIQRAMALENNVIMDGRDIGSVVLPHANLKIYLDASVSVRAKRRFEEMPTHPLKEIEAQIYARDELDKNRSISPLIIPKNAIIINTDYLTIYDVVKKINNLYLSLIEERK